jgi:hypothetical protein
MLPQLPSDPDPFLAALQAWQVPPQGLLQQTPSTQLVELHWPPVEQGAPFISRLWQMPALQIPDVQSLPPAQPWPAPQVGQVPPPQSMPVSEPFWNMSVQLGATQRLPEQTRLVQSLATLQPWPLAQVGQVPPPQSTPVSEPFWIMSMQVAGMLAHTPLEQKPEVQSPSIAQPWPFAQVGQVPPPQSTPVSAPFCVASLQVAGAGTGAQTRPVLFTVIGCTPNWSVSVAVGWFFGHLAL